MTKYNPDVQFDLRVRLFARCNFPIMSHLSSPSRTLCSWPLLVSLPTDQLNLYLPACTVCSSMFWPPFDSTNLQASRGSFVSCFALHCEYYSLNKRHWPWCRRCSCSHPHLIVARLRFNLLSPRIFTSTSALRCACFLGLVPWPY